MFEFALNSQIIFNYKVVSCNTCFFIHFVLLFFFMRPDGPFRGHTSALYAIRNREIGNDHVRVFCNLPISRKAVGTLSVVAAAVVVVVSSPGSIKRQHLTLAARLVQGS